VVAEARREDPLTSLRAFASHARSPTGTAGPGPRLSAELHTCRRRLSGLRTARPGRPGPEPASLTSWTSAAGTGTGPWDRQPPAESRRLRPGDRTPRLGVYRRRRRVPPCRPPPLVKSAAPPLRDWPSTVGSLVHAIDRSHCQEPIDSATGSSPCSAAYAPGVRPWRADPARRAEHRAGTPSPDTSWP
jgi:hypothetical protein